MKVGKSSGSTIISSQLGHGLRRMNIVPMFLNIFIPWGVAWHRKSISFAQLPWSLMASCTEYSCSAGRSGCDYWRVAAILKSFALAKCWTLTSCCFFWPSFGPRWLPKGNGPFSCGWHLPTGVKMLRGSQGWKSLSTSPDWTEIFVYCFGLSSFYLMYAPGPLDLGGFGVCVLGTCLPWV